VSHHRVSPQIDQVDTDDIAPIADCPQMTQMTQMTQMAQMAQIHRTIAWLKRKGRQEHPSQRCAKTSHD
jgi:hypothetical protein